MPFACSTSASARSAWRDGAFAENTQHVAVSADRVVHSVKPHIDRPDHFPAASHRRDFARDALQHARRDLRSSDPAARQAAMRAAGRASRVIRDANRERPLQSGISTSAATAAPRRRRVCAIRVGCCCRIFVRIRSREQSARDFDARCFRFRRARLSRPCCRVRFRQADRDRPRHRSRRPHRGRARLNGHSTANTADCDHQRENHTKHHVMDLRPASATPPYNTGSVSSQLVCVSRDLREMSGKQMGLFTIS